MPLLIATVIALFAQSLLALLVIQKDRSLRNISFAFLSFALLFWAGLSFAFEAFPSAQNIYAVRFTMLFVVLQNTFFALFSYSFQHNRLKATKKIIAFGCLSFFAASVALTPLLFVELAEGPRGPYPIAGPGMLIFVIHAAISLTLGFRGLWRQLKRSHGSFHQQFIYIFLGSLVLWGIVPLTNFAFSIAFKTTFFGQLSPLYGFAFSSLIAYAIIKHKLFDIRTAAARGLTYLLSLGVVVIVYTFFLLTLSETILSDSGTYQRVFYVVFAVVTALSFQPLKRFFDKTTSRLFFRDIYDPELLLDQLNDILVRTVQLDDLLHETSELIRSTLKSSYVKFVLAHYSDSRGPTNGKQYVFERKELEGFTVLLNKNKKKLFTIEELSDVPHAHLHELMQENDIAVAVRLASHTQRIGYLILGSKQSGEAYLNHDLKTLDLIADELALAIQNAIHFEEIQHFNIKLQEEVKRATHQLREANQRLRVLDRTKDDFISMASHQLRTPLTSVKGYLSMTLEGDGGAVNGKQRKLLSQAFISSQRMVYLIADMLNVSRLKTGKFVIEPEPTDLADAVQTEIEQLKGTAQARGLKLTFNKPRNFPTLSLDQTKIRQVIMNFIDNAIYYTPSGGRIDVALKDTGQAIEFTVTDDGIGVPKHEQHHLFNKFYRAKNAKKARPDGTGLGLYMAKKVVIAQGGGIVFHSQEGKGSTFGFTIAKAKLQPSAQPHEDNVETTT